MTTKRSSMQEMVKLVLHDCSCSLRGGSLFIYLAMRVVLDGLHSVVGLNKAAWMFSMHSICISVVP